MTVRIHIDFACPPSAVPLRAWLLLAAGLLAVVVVAWQWQTAQRRLRDGAAARQALVGKPALATALSAADAAALATQLAAAQAVAARLNQAWPALFRKLETVRVPGVMLMAIQPDTGGSGAGGASGGTGDTQRFRLVAQAPRYRAALDYVGALTATPGLAGAHLSAHEVLATTTGSTGVQFTVQVEWAPPR